MLGVCRRLLLHRCLDSLLSPLADLLQHLSLKYGDTDIQDHARLYYTLLTTLSRDKLSGVLIQRGPEGGRQAKVRSLSSIMAESEELTSALTIRQTERSLLKLVKLDRPEQQGGDVMTEDPDRLEVSPGVGVLDDYRVQFSKPDFASEITLNYQLTHAEGHQPCFSQLFSIRLHFDLTDCHYEEVGDISVPCLFSERAPPVVRLRLRPRQPYPTTLRASAVFTAQDGHSWHTALPDVHVAFPQVFLPLPVPLAWGREHKRRVFEGLWDQICSGESDKDVADCATTLFCCQLEDAAVRVLVQKHFQPYLLSDCKCEDGLKVLVLLPPQSHLLLKISAEEDALHIAIATDNWELLPHINSYLQTITEEISLLHSVD